MSATNTKMPDDRDPIGALFGLDQVPGLSGGVLAGYEHAPQEWRDAAVAALLECVAEGEPFTVDDLRRRGVPEPDKPQRWGSLFAYGVNRKLIQLFDFAQQDRTSRDPAIVRVWLPGPQAPTGEGTSWK